jgi:hypothetical protein
MEPATDKRSLLQVIAPYIKNVTVPFPRIGCEELLRQLLNLGVESHDDLVGPSCGLFRGSSSGNWDSQAYGGLRRDAVVDSEDRRRPRRQSMALNNAWASAIAAISSSVVAIILAVTGLIERRKDSKRETMLNALEHLTGGSQKRSVGIALIEGLWCDGHPFDRAILPALVNQALYLLLETESGGGRHQVHNWLRIMNLIMRVPARKEFHQLYCELADALRCRTEETEMPSVGVQIATPTSAAWLKKISKHASL